MRTHVIDRRANSRGEKMRKKRLRARSFVYYDIKAKEKKKEEERKATKRKQNRGKISANHKFFFLSPLTEYNQVRFSGYSFFFFAAASITYVRKGRRGVF